MCLKWCFYVICWKHEDSTDWSMFLIMMFSVFTFMFPFFGFFTRGKHWKITFQSARNFLGPCLSHVTRLSIMPLGWPFNWSQKLTDLTLRFIENPICKASQNMGRTWQWRNDGMFVTNENRIIANSDRITMLVFFHEFVGWKCKWIISKAFYMIRYFASAWTVRRQFLWS